MDGHRGGYAKWKESHRERQTLYDFTYMWNLKNKMNKRAKQKQTQLQRTHWWLPDGRLGRLSEKGEEINTNWQLQNSHRAAKYSIGHVVNSTVVTVCGATWALDLMGGSLRKLYKCLAIMLYTWN